MSAELRPLAPAVENWRRLRTELAANFDLTEDDDFLPDTLDGMTDLGDQMHALMQRAAEQEAFADALESMIQQSRSRKERLKKAAATIRSHVAEAAAEAGIKKLPRPDMTLSFGMTKPALSGDADPVSLPDEFVRTKREINRVAVKEAIEAGRDVPGFMLSNGRPTVTVRRS